MTFWEACLVLLTGVGAGTINTIVGSGTLITFPTLLALGFSPVSANVSNCIGLAVGGSSGIWGYRRELAGLGGFARALLPLSVAGAAVGAVLLLRLPEQVFEGVVPVLIAASLVLVVLQPRIAAELRERSVRRDTAMVADGDPPESSAEAVPDQTGGGAFSGLSRRRWATLRTGVTGVGVYGGYFGAAQGVLLVGVLGTLLPIALQPVNALKNVLGTAANATAAVTFVLVARDQIDVAAVVLIAAGSLIGGLLGAGIGRRLPPTALRAVIVVVGLVALVRLVTT